MSFEQAYREFIDTHSARRDGERLRRLSDGHGHAEKTFVQNVWWPAFGHFDNLHPEYEITDYHDTYRYIDFAYITANFRMAIEIDGYGPHWRHASRWQFADTWRRQNHLVVEGWEVLRFAFDDVDTRPKICMQTIQQLMGILLNETHPIAEMSVEEREVIRLIVRSNGTVTPSDVRLHLKIGKDLALKLLNSLTMKQWLEPASGFHRIRSYKLHPSRNRIKL